VFFFVFFFWGGVVNLCIQVTSESIMGIISFKLFVSLRKNIYIIFFNNNCFGGNFIEF
jgi:hypothetical protein